MTKNTQSRKWQVTINNPVDKGYTHERIREELGKMKSLVYWCLSDEVGLDTHTPHTHVFLAASSGIRFGTVQKRFEGAHIEYCMGTSQQNRDYVFKEGKYAGSAKEDSRVEGTQEEWGEMPVERQGKRNDLVDIYDMIRSGLSDFEILETCPEQMLNLKEIQQTRQVIRQTEFENTFRELDVTYICGNTGTGKTRYVMETYGYSNVYRVTNYKHPFDGYDGQDVLLFDEFRSSLPLSDMLQYLDGYPINLPSRYNDKHALYTKVYFATNIPLTAQYTKIQRDEQASYLAFLRRISHVYECREKDWKQMTLDDYMKQEEDFKPYAGTLPFKEV